MKKQILCRICNKPIHQKSDLIVTWFLKPYHKPCYYNKKWSTTKTFLLGEYPINIGFINRGIVIIPFLLIILIYIQFFIRYKLSLYFLPIFVFIFFIFPIFIRLYSYFKYEKLLNKKSWR